MTACVHDSSGRRASDSQLGREQALEAVARRQRLSLLGEFFAETAHEVAQPLAAIRLFAESALHALDEEPLDTNQLREWLDVIRTQAEHVQGILGRFESVGRRDEGRLEAVPIPASLDRVLPLLRVMGERSKVRITTDIPDDLPPVWADPVALDQVLLNLLRNALQAVADVPARRRRVTVAARVEGPVVVVRVSDRGRGVSPEIRSRLFEPYATTRPDGTGLGLAISRRLVEAHGGRLDWVPEETEGATFELRWPAAPRAD